MRPEPCAFIGNERGARGIERAAQVDGHDAVPVLRTGVLDQLPGIDAGVLDDDVEPAVAFERQGDRCFGVGHLARCRCG